MSSIGDLKNVLSEALENKGVLGELKSRLRAEVFSVLEDNTYQKPAVSQENLLINELIREYMDYNHYRYSQSVFIKETNQQTTPLHRDIIAAELHIREDTTTKQVPLIYTILWSFLNNEPTSTSEANATEAPLSNYKNREALVANAMLSDVAKRNGASKNSSSTVATVAANKNINIYKYNQEQFD